MAVWIGLAALTIWIGAALAKYKTWARMTALIMSLISLLNFPVGTFFAVIILFHLLRGWRETGAAAA